MLVIPEVFDGELFEIIKFYLNMLNPIYERMSDKLLIKFSNAVDERKGYNYFISSTPFKCKIIAD